MKENKTSNKIIIITIILLLLISSFIIIGFIYNKGKIYNKKIYNVKIVVEEGNNKKEIVLNNNDLNKVSKYINKLKESKCNCASQKEASIIVNDEFEIIFGKKYAGAHYINDNNIIMVNINEEFYNIVTGIIKENSINDFELIGGIGDNDCLDVEEPLIVNNQKVCYFYCEMANTYKVKKDNKYYSLKDALENKIVTIDELIDKGLPCNKISE